MSTGSSGSEDPLLFEMNTTPLIDVLLVLIIMLIVTIPLQTHAVKMTLPASSARMPPAPPNRVRVDIGADGSIRWNGDPVADRADLEARLSRLAVQSEPAALHLYPHRQVRYKVVAMVLASAQRLGVHKIGLVSSERLPN